MRHDMNGKQKQAYAKIETNLAEIQRLIKECEGIAEENEISFNLRTPRKDMEYIPESAPQEDPWNSSDTVSGWMTSSDYC